MRKNIGRKNEKAKIDYFVIDPAKLEAEATVSDQEQRDYYEKNKAKYNVAEKRQASYIYLDTVKQRSFVTVNNDELKQYYDQHQSEYNLPERITAQHILFKTQGKSAEEIEAIKNKARGVLDRAKKGEDFAGLAKQFPTMNSSKISGGDLGSFTRGQMVPEFDNVAFGLGPGAISDLVQTQFGIHIIKVVSKQEARARPLQELEGAIRSIVSTRKAEHTQLRSSQRSPSNL